MVVSTVPIIAYIFLKSSEIATFHKSLVTQLQYLVTNLSSFLFISPEIPSIHADLAIFHFLTLLIISTPLIISSPNDLLFLTELDTLSISPFHYCRRYSNFRNFPLHSPQVHLSHKRAIKIHYSVKLQLLYFLTFCTSFQNRFFFHCRFALIFLQNYSFASFLSSYCFLLTFLFYFHGLFFQNLILNF